MASPYTYSSSNTLIFINDIRWYFSTEFKDKGSVSMTLDSSEAMDSFSNTWKVTEIVSMFADKGLHKSAIDILDMITMAIRNPKDCCSVKVDVMANNATLTFTWMHRAPLEEDELRSCCFVLNMQPLTESQTLQRLVKLQKNTTWKHKITDRLNKIEFANLFHYKKNENDITNLIGSLCLLLVWVIWLTFR